MNPNLAAVLGAFLLGLFVFPWRSTTQALGLSGYFLFAGSGFLVTGLALYARQGLASPMTARALGIALAMVALYVPAILFCSVAFSAPGVNVPVVTAITAAYPVVTAAISLGLGQRFTLRETAFFLLAVVGVIGLGLSSRPPQ